MVLKIKFYNGEQELKITGLKYLFIPETENYIFASDFSVYVVKSF